MNIHGVLEVLGDSAQKTASQLNSVLESVRGVHPENQTAQGMQEQGVFGKLERLAFHLKMIDDRVQELHTRIGEVPPNGPSIQNSPVGIHGQIGRAR